MKASSRLQMNMRREEQHLPPLDRPKKRIFVTGSQTSHAWRSPGWSSTIRDYNHDTFTGRPLPSWNDRFHVSGSGNDTRFSHVSRRHYFDGLATAQLSKDITGQNRNNRDRSQESRTGFSSHGTQSSMSLRLASLGNTVQTWLSAEGACEGDAVDNIMRGVTKRQRTVGAMANASPRTLPFIPIAPSPPVHSQLHLGQKGSPHDKHVRPGKGTSSSVLPVVEPKPSRPPAVSSEAHAPFFSPHNAQPEPEEKLYQAVPVAPLATVDEMSQNSPQRYLSQESFGSSSSVASLPSPTMPPPVVEESHSSWLFGNKKKKGPTIDEEERMRLAKSRLTARVSQDGHLTRTEEDGSGNAPSSGNAPRRSGRRQSRCLDDLRLKTGNTMAFSLGVDGVCKISFSEIEQDIIHGYFDLHDSNGSGSLDFQELLKVIQDLGRTPPSGTQDAETMHRLLREQDTNGNDEETGAILKDALRPILCEFQQAGFKAGGQELADLFYRIDYGEDGVLDFQEFCDFMIEFRSLEFEHIKNSAGFGAVELDFLQNIFEEADEDKSGSLGISEVIKLLEKTLLGSAVETQDEIEKIVALFARLDKDKSLTLDFQEFLRLLRVRSNDRQTSEILDGFKDWVEVKRKSLKEGLKETPEKPKGTGMARLSMIRARTERIAKLFSGDDSQELTTMQLEKLTNNMQKNAVELEVEDNVLAQQWRVSVEEVRCLRESFEFCDIDGSGFIDRNELRIILKNIGWPTYTSEQKAALDEVLARSEFQEDLDFSHTLQFVLAYNDTIARSIVTTLGHKDRCIPMESLVAALYQVGQYLNKKSANALLQEASGKSDNVVDRVDEQTFFKMLRIVRAQRIFDWRSTCGFDKEEIAKFKAVCQKHNGGAAEGAIQLERRRVIAVLEDLGCSVHPEDRVVLTKALLRVDREGCGEMSFQDVLLLVRHLKNLEQQMVVKSEADAAQASGLDSTAVGQLREVFSEYKTPGSDKIPFKKTHLLLGELGIVTKSEHKQLLQSVMLDVVGEDRDGLTFAQFLQTLHKFELREKNPKMDL